MGLFRQFHKPAFWSQLFLGQLFLGMVAILTLPNAQPILNETEQSTIANQQSLTLSDLSQFQYNEKEQTYFFIEPQFSLNLIEKQAVIFCEFFVKSYRFDDIATPPIRAGPYA
ncbi:secA translation cis-regulator SecM [Ursidibacter sp. B-7004-1]